MTENNNSTNNSFLQEEQSPIQLIDIWYMIWDHKWWYVACTCLCLLIAGFQLYRTPNVYTSSAKVIIDESEQDATMRNMGVISSGMMRRSFSTVVNEMEAFKSPDLMQTVVEPSYAHFGGNKICFPIYGMNMLGGFLNNRNLLANETLVKKFNYEIENFRKASSLYDEGCEILKKIIPQIPEKKRENALRIMGIGRFISNTAKTAANVKEFLKRKEKLLASSGEERNRLVSELLDICRDEIANAKDTLPLVEFDSRLGYEPSMEYMCDPAHIEWKLSVMERLVNEELPSYFV